LVATDSNGCNSNLTLLIVISGGDTNNISLTSCDTAFTFGGQQINGSGVYSQRFQNTAGCDSLVILTVTILGPDTVSQSVTICSDSTLVFGGQQVNAAGIYTHSFKNLSGCDSSVTLTVSIANPEISTIDVSTCVDTSFIFGGKQIDTTGVYIFTFQNAAGCDSTVELSLTEEIVPFVDFAFSPSIAELNMPIHFTNRSLDCTNYIWNFGDSTFGTEVNPSHQYLQSREYLVCLTGWNATGCTSTVCRRVSAEVLFTIDVPNAFSPNGDGANDALYVKGLGVKEFTFRAYNRWGQVVFETNDLNKGWDGSFKGNQQVMETVAYTIHATFLDNSTTEKQGNITILK
jgi:gliding motility-associated-like protein